MGERRLVVFALGVSGVERVVSVRVPSAERESRPAACWDTAAAYSSAGLPGAMARNEYVMDVRVPEGAQPGQSMLVAAPTGQQVHVEIPDYATPGSTIAVSVPGAGPPPVPGAADVRKLVRAGYLVCSV